MMLGLNRCRKAPNVGDVKQQMLHVVDMYLVQSYSFTNLKSSDLEMVHVPILGISNGHQEYENSRSWPLGKINEVAKLR